MSSFPPPHHLFPVALGPAHKAAWLPSTVGSWKRPLLTHPVNRILHQQHSHTARAVAFVKTKHCFASGEVRLVHYASSKIPSAPNSLLLAAAAGEVYFFSLL